MRSRQLACVAISLLTIYGCGGSSPSPDATDLPKDTVKDMAADKAPDGGGTGGSDASADKPDAGDTPDAADAPDASKDATDGGGDVDVGGPPPCTVATECPGMDSECAHRTCTAGVCGVANEVLGKVLATQVIGDCHVRQCTATGTVTTVNDDKDIPDDINPCTKDACTAGVASHTPVAKDSTCGGGKLCNATGQCVGCNVASDCTGTDNFCRTRTCVQNVCGVTFKTLGTKLVDAQSGDCKIQQCDGAGVIQTVADATDLPVDNNPCTQDQCNGETPTHQPVARNTSCGGAQICDGASHCVTCLTPATCPGTDTDCQSRTCTNGACGTAFAAAGKATTAQTAGDCSKKQCNGNGGVVSVIDNTDPFVDNNPCTKDQCDNGTSSNPPLPARTNCGANVQCDGNGACVQCITVADCAGTDTDCQARTCIGGMCGISFKPAGTPASAQTAGDCKQNQCDGKGATVTVADDTDPQNDNNACTSDICSGGVNQHPNVAAKVSCGAPKECDGNGNCVGCVQASECGTNTDCITYACTSGTCGHTAAAPGAPVSVQMAGDCRKNRCDGAGNIADVADNTDSPPDDGNQCTSDVCLNGAPVHPSAPKTMTCNQMGGIICNGSGACVQCNNAADCGTNNPCHSFMCVAGLCMTTNLSPPQTAGDCQTIVCDNSGQPVSMADNNDKPTAGTCTVGVCTAGVPSVQPSPTTATCSANGATHCDGAGACVACNTKADCGADTECLKQTCVSNSCVPVPQTGVALVTQIPGNCRKETCDSDGNPLGSDPFDSDLPNDSNPCTQDLCNGGAVQHPPESMQVTCGLSGHCDGLGTCVGCNVDADCGATDECKVNTCNQTTHACNPTVLTPVDTALAAQASGDCKKTVCDGNGGTKENVDKTDVPTDSNECTVGACADDGTPSNPIVVDHPCQTNGVCSGTGTCVGCNTDAECDSVHNTECRINTCLNNSCSTATSPMFGHPLAVQTVGNCQLEICDGMGGTTTTVDNTDKPVDTNDCTDDVCTNGAPSNPNLAGAACTQNAGTRCDGASPSHCVPSFMVVRVGPAIATPQIALTSAGTPVFVEERTVSDGSVARTISIPATAAAIAGTSNKVFTLSGVGSSEGAISRSGDGHSVVLGGYSAAAGAVNGTSGVNSIPSTTSPREVAVIDALGNVNTTTTLGTSAFSGDNIRSAATDAGSQFFTAGNGSSANRGIFRTSPLGASANSATARIESDTKSTRVCQVIPFGASPSMQLFCTAANANFNLIFSVGTFPLPDGTAILTPAPLPGTVDGTGLPLDINASVFAFAFTAYDGNGHPQTVYVADERPTASGGGIYKWTLAGGTWSKAGVFSKNLVDGVRGLVAIENAGGTVTLVATTAPPDPASGTAPPTNSIVTFTDTPGIAITDSAVTVLKTSDTFTSTTALTLFRGVSLPPK